MSLEEMSNQNAAFGVKRLSSANYHPTIWGNHFFTYQSQTKAIDVPSEQQFEGLKEEVRRMLIDIASEANSQKLAFIDAVQRLGVGYHFKSEMENVLEFFYHNFNEENDLKTVALRFRLLRQNGINVSCDAFEKFIDSEGKFKQSLANDVMGMLSLYEAAHLGVRGEGILEEAIVFTTTNLQLLLPKLSSDHAKQVSHALNRPIRKWLPRLEARHYLDAYTILDKSYNKTLLKFAKLDFNRIQEVHQKELDDITEWWKNMDVAAKLPYARDRVVECYFWMMGIYFEPQFSFARIIMTKILAILSLVDDTYDNFGTLEELEVFTNAIHRWEMKAEVTLPEYMKIIYSAIIDVYSEAEEYVAKEGRLYCMQYLREALNRVVRHYFIEAKWRDNGYVPTMEEYTNISLVSTCYPCLATTCFFGMGEIADINAFDWVSKDPKIVRASAIICRYMDDIVSHEFEQKREHVASGVECYIKEHGVSEEEVIKLFRKEIINAWKDINEEFLQPTSVAMALLERVLNLSRAMDVIYKDDDGYTNSYIVKEYVASILKDPVLV